MQVPAHLLITELRSTICGALPPELPKANAYLSLVDDEVLDSMEEQPGVADEDEDLD